MSVDVVHNLDSKLQEIRSALHNAGIYVSIPWLMWWAAKASTLNSESALFQLICQDFTRAYTFPLFESTSDETCSHGLFQCLAVVDLSISPFQRNQTNGSGASDELLPNYSSRRGSNFKAILHNGFEKVVCIDMTNAHGSALRLRELGPGMKVLLCNFKRYGSFVLMNEHTTMRQFGVPQFQGIHAPSHDASLWSEHKSEANSHPGRPQEHAHTRTVTGCLVCLDSVVPYDSTQLQHHFVLIAWLKNSENDENIKVFFTSDVIASYIVKSCRHGRTEQRSGIECLAKDDICRMLSELGTRTFTLVNQIPSLDAQMVVEIEEPRVK